MDRRNWANAGERGSVLVGAVVYLAFAALLVLAGVGALRLAADRMRLSNVAEDAVRNAVARDEGASVRPTPAEVQSRVDSAARGLDIAAVNVSPEPARAASGQAVEVVVVARHQVGPLGALVNGIAGIVGKDPVFTDGELLITESAVAVVP